MATSLATNAVIVTRVHCILILILGMSGYMTELFTNNGDPDQMTHVASDLGLHCLPITALGVFRLQRAKICLNLSTLQTRKEAL